jgi:hypothetical protein
MERTHRNREKMKQAINDTHEEQCVTRSGQSHHLEQGVAEQGRAEEASALPGQDKGVTAAARHDQEDDEKGKGALPAAENTNRTAEVMTAACAGGNRASRQIRDRGKCLLPRTRMPLMRRGPARRLPAKYPRWPAARQTALTNSIGANVFAGQSLKWERSMLGLTVEAPPQRMADDLSGITVTSIRVWWRFHRVIILPGTP